MKAKFHTERRKTRRGSSYGGYTEWHEESWIVCVCGWENPVWSHSRETQWQNDQAILEHRIEHLEEGELDGR